MRFLGRLFRQLFVRPIAAALRRGLARAVTRPLNRAISRLLG